MLAYQTGVATQPMTLTTQTYLRPLPASINRNHACVLLPRGDSGKSAISTLVLLCLAQVFSTDAEAFAYGKTPVDAENSY